MQKLVFTNGNGLEIDLTAGNFGITNWAGLSDTSLNIQTQQVPFEDGGVFLGALIEQREIELTVAIYDGNNLELRYQKKRELISALNPKAGEGVLVYTNDYLTRQIKAVPQLPIFENKNSNDSGTLKASVVFSCPSPYWEDVEETVIKLDLNNPVHIDNVGDVNIGVEIEIFGEGSNPSIKNITTQKQIKYNGGTFPISINTTTGNKSAETKEIGFNVVRDGVENREVKFFEEYGCYFIATTNGIKKSIDTIEWEIIPLGVIITSISCSENGVLIAVGKDGSIYYSSDSLEWVSITSLEETSMFWSSCYMKNTHKFFICTLSKTYCSSDGLTWELSNNAGGYKLYYNDEIQELWCVGSSYKCSEDGENWTTYASSTSEAKDIIYHNGTYVITDGGIRKSTNKTTWTEIVVSDLASASSICYSENLKEYIVTCERKRYGGEYYQVFTSSNLNTWQSFDTPATGGLRSIVYNKYTTECLIVGNNSNILKSQDMQNYTVLMKSDNTINKIFECKELDLILTIGNNGEIKVGKDINNLQKVDSHSENDLTGIIYNTNLQKLFVVGNNGTVLSSTNAMNWSVEETNIANDESIRGICYSDKLNLMVICTSSGKIAKSSSGTDWVSTAISDNPEFTTIFYSTQKEMFFVGCYMIEDSTYNFLYRSSNANNWVGCSIPHAPFYQLNQIDYFEKIKKYVAVGSAPISGGVLFISDDGINWSVVNRFEIPLHCINYFESYNVYIIGADDGYIFISNDCYSWEESPIKYTTSDLYSCILSSKGGGTEIIGGQAGTIITSILIGKTNVIQNITSDSDMNFGLREGDNLLMLLGENGVFSALLKFRQKYIGV